MKTYQARAVFKERFSTKINCIFAFSMVDNLGPRFNLEKVPLTISKKIFSKNQWKNKPIEKKKILLRGGFQPLYVKYLRSGFEYFLEGFGPVHSPIQTNFSPSRSRHALSNKHHFNIKVHFYPPENPKRPPKKCEKLEKLV